MSQGRSPRDAAGGADLGADALVAAGLREANAAAALEAEAWRRLARGQYFSHIAYMTPVARTLR